MTTNEENVLSHPSLGAQTSEIPPSTSRFRDSLSSWILAIAWIGCIAFFSSDRFSANQTGSILRWLLDHTVGHVDEILFAKIHFFVRKAAHLSVYCILGLLAYNAWKKSLPSRSPWMFRWALLALLTVAITGSLDEWHQSYIPSRTASPVDVGLDTTGGFIGQLMIAALALRKRNGAE